MTSRVPASKTAAMGPPNGRGVRARPAAHVRESEPEQTWRAFQSARGLKASSARDTVVEVFLKTKGHVDLHSLYVQTRKRHPGTGFATVYRTMKLLEEAGVAHARHFGDSAETLYEIAAGRSHHDHLICVACGRIEEFESPQVERAQDRIAAEYGFTLSGHRHELYGTCAQCEDRKGAQSKPGRSVTKPGS